MSLAVHVPTEEEIRYLVGQVVAGEVKPLDTVITRAIWAGQPVPATWGGWPPEAVKAWSLGCKIYQEMVKATQPWKKGARNPLSLDISWDVILGFATNPAEWWFIPGVTWAKIGARIGTSPRTAAYRMGSLGWKLIGSGMRVPYREVVLAPCSHCGRVWQPRQINNRLGCCCESWNGVD